MKRFIAILSSLFVVLSLGAQTIYSKVTKYDKFDDVVWTRQVKTIITKSLSTIVVETKGQNPVEYEYIDEPWFVVNTGSRDKVVNLVEDIYGYESLYHLFPKGTIANTLDDVRKDIPDSLATDEMVDAKLKLALMVKADDTPTITFRNISWSQYNFDYKNELVWIRFKDGSRLIYTK